MSISHPTDTAYVIFTTLGSINTRRLDQKYMQINFLTPEKERNPDYAKFIERFSEQLDKAFRDNAIFAFKCKLLDHFQIAIFLHPPSEPLPDNVTCNIAGQYQQHENRILIFSKLCQVLSDEGIYELIIHECEHAYKTNIHRIRWNDLAVKDESLAAHNVVGHSLAYFPYTDNEREKFTALIQLGLNRVYQTFPELLAKAKTNSLQTTEVVQLRRYCQALTQYMPKQEILFDIPASDLGDLSSIELRQKINSGQTFYIKEIKLHIASKAYVLNFYVDKVEAQQQSNIYCLHGTFHCPEDLQKHLNPQMTSLDWKYQAFMDEVKFIYAFPRTHQYEEIIELHVRVLSKFPEQVLLEFFPELIQYDDQDTRLALSSPSCELQVPTCYQGILFRANRNRAIDAKLRPLQQFSMFAVHVQKILAKQNIDVTLTQYCSFPLLPHQHYDSFLIDLVCQTRCKDDLIKLTLLLAPIKHRLAIHPKTNEVVIEKTNENTEELTSLVQSHFAASH